MECPYHQNIIVVLHLKYNLASKSYSCYSSLTIPSGRPPWLENIKTTERLIRDTYKRNEVLQNAMLDEFIKDTLHAEIVGIVSSTLTVCIVQVYLKILVYRYKIDFTKFCYNILLNLIRRTNQGTKAKQNS